jgi:hypothetical protein
VVCFHVQNSEGGSPCLSQLLIDRLALVSKFDYVLVHMRLGPANLVASMVAGLDDIIPNLHDVY